MGLSAAIPEVGKRQAAAATTIKRPQGLMLQIRIG
jgi:hypothetical protein